MTMTNMDTIDIDKKVPLPVKVCDRFGLSCSFCKQGAHHHSPLQSDWSDEDWNGTQTKAQKETGETNLLSDWDLPKSQSEPNSKPEVDKLNIDKLHLEQDNPKEEWIEITDSLILPPTTSEEEEKATIEEITDEMMEAEKKYQQEEEKYMLQENIYIGQLSKEEESSTGLEYSGYSYFA